MKDNVTIYDIARLAGVSVSAASTAFSRHPSSTRLSEKTRQRIFDVARENNYVPNISARATRSRKSFLLGFFYRMRNSHLLGGILRGIRSVCREKDYDIIVYPSESLAEEARNLQSPHVYHLDGVISVPVLEDGKSNSALYQNLSSRGIPLIQLLVDLLPGIPFIGRDYRRIGQEAVMALHSRGHRRIAAMVFSNYRDPVGGAGNWALTEGLQDAASKMDVKLTIHPIAPSDNDAQHYVRNAEATMEEVLSQIQRPTALIAASGLLAAGAYTCCVRHGVAVPSELSLLACGDDAEALLWNSPEIACFPVPLEEMGRQCAEYCLAEKESPLIGRHLLYRDYCPGETLETVSVVQGKEQTDIHKRTRRHP